MIGVLLAGVKRPAGHGQAWYRVDVVFGIDLGQLLGDVGWHVAFIRRDTGFLDFRVEQGKAAHHGQFRDDLAGDAEFQAVVLLTSVHDVDVRGSGVTVGLLDVEQRQGQQGFAQCRLGTDFVLFADFRRKRLAGIGGAARRDAARLQAFYIRRVGGQPRQRFIDQRDVRRGLALVVGGLGFGGPERLGVDELVGVGFDLCVGHTQDRRPLLIESNDVTDQDVIAFRTVGQALVAMPDGVRRFTDLRRLVQRYRAHRRGVLRAWLIGRVRNVILVLFLP